MKLGEIRGERAFEVLAEIVPAIADIVGDRRVIELLSGRRAGEESGEYLTRLAKEVAPYLLREHSRELIRVLAAIEGREREEYAASITLCKLPKLLLELLADEELGTLFTCAEADVT